MNKDQDTFPKLISTQFLLQHLHDEHLIILSISQETKNASSKSFQELNYIPNSINVNIKKDFSDTTNELPNTICSPEHFDKKCSKMGISKDSYIVVYDREGIYFSPRIWWLFKVMGHQNISILNGGLKAWKEDKLPTQKMTKTTFIPTQYKSLFDPFSIVPLTNILGKLNDQNFQLIDARSTSRFEGTSAEPRAGLDSGHIPNSINIPYTEVLAQGKFKSKNELKLIFEQFNLNVENDIIYSCGSGITACIVLFAYYLCYDKMGVLYDGSWTEWAQTKGCPIITVNHSPD